MSMTTIDNEHEQLVSMVNQLMDEREILYRENEYLKAKLNESILVETIQEMKKERYFLLKLLSNLTINNNQDEQLRYVKHHMKENDSNFLPTSSYPTFSSKPVHYDNSLAEQNSMISRHNSSVTNNHNRVHRLKTNVEQHKQQQQQQQQPTVIYRIDNSKENLMNNSDRLSSSSLSSTHMKNSQSNKKFFVYKTSIIPQTQESNKLIRKHDCQLKHSQNSPFQHYRSQSLQDLT
ncbi:unnamed protein product [Rotaria sp. Silwood2]|nr:unnamed protein product [Rotaria sp. Silwood2]CAF2721363.1 unnamed protein product [Rotaria sp. Silwood2]CAF2984927.1 unnamed protein product [Rotaria sp. Silwood2]CAF3140981.1 unnamed protein product [Rotaria sp. Silwood2]CAF3907752.1 unnamed protein product [Rotaria sp. Silwood2]